MAPEPNSTPESGGASQTPQLQKILEQPNSMEFLEPQYKFVEHLFSCSETGQNRGRHGVGVKLPAIATGYTSESLFFLFSLPRPLPLHASAQSPDPTPFTRADRGSPRLPSPPSASRGRAGRAAPPPLSQPLSPAPSLRLSSPPPPSIPHRWPVKEKTRRRSSSTLTLEKGKKGASPPTGGRRRRTRAT